MYLILALTFLFLLLGIALKFLKWDWLIAGYNTMSKEKKQEVDIVGLRNFLSNSMFIMATIFLVAFLFFYAGYNIAGQVIFSILIVYSIFMTFYLQRFNHNKKNRSKTVIILLLLLLVTGVFVFGLIFFGGKEPEVLIDTDQITISGMYGLTIPIDELTEIQLIEQIPQITARTNGYSVGSILKGNFKLEEYGKGKLFLMSDQGPFILLRSQEDFYIINFNEVDKTMELYELIGSYFLLY